jgi:general nucleoside transport system permease protein
MSPTRQETAIVAMSLLIALTVTSTIVIACGWSPALVWGHLIVGTLTDGYHIGQVVAQATTLSFAGLAVALALDIGMFNIGAESQMTCGIVTAAVVGAALPATLPAPLAIIACLLAAMGVGALAASLIALAKTWRGAHEVVTGIAFNAIIGGIALWLGNSVLYLDGRTRSATIVDAATIPPLGLGGSSANWMAVAAVGCACLLSWLRHRTQWGQRWRLVGSQPQLATVTGVRNNRTIVIVMMCAGALAALAAGNLVLGQQHAYENGLGRGMGYMAIAVALLGRQHPIGILISALFISVLSVGGLVINDVVPKELSEIMIGMVIVSVAVAPAIIAKLQHYRSTGVLAPSQVPT